ncbi:MAG: hypothetical protein SF182_06655 [Deltaproteobacteria bacterium]|nr:hypothetical protein [Deltaproteobacteria bacterium]
MRIIRTSLASLAIAATAVAARGAVTAPAGYIYSTQLLGNLTQSCVAAGVGGTFVGIGPSFTANAESIVLAKESGELRLVASGFNAIADCAYDRAADVLYVTDNADNGDFGLAGPFAAQSGDTVFAIPNASTASGLSAPGLELLPPNSLPFAAAVSIDATGNVFVTSSAGGNSGGVTKIVGGTPSAFASGMDFASGLAFNPANGNLFVAESLDSFDVQIRQFTSGGTPLMPDPFAGPAFSFGSYDAAFNSDGRLLVTGAFGGDIVSFNPADSSMVSFVSGLNFATGITVDAQTHRVQVLSSTFSNAPEDRSLHRFTPIDQLSAGGGSPATDCLQEAYGLQLTDGVAECTDGAACDADGAVNDGCVFTLGFCLNVADPDLAGCSNASPIDSLTIAAKPASAALATASAQISAGLPLSGTTCGFSDGYYVPLKITGAGERKDGKAKVKVTTVAADGRKDSDSYKFVCHPAP